ncbi:MAG: hypothetical protein QF890_08020 [Myxococcota bacterium]|jgi:hypothetical protein|nr:hypothetical protein [Myxococcota bacterium]MDP7075061.1 hypothetical protein [Myxococcota bacterium]MDP7299879.1 hypothetical protein [Myxococcota bacterium]MDP7432504.1 hypothetical protein [Myxococcota bacterium]HJO24522.1 hypothetical protein [Myxococcota bacterium]
MCNGADARIANGEGLGPVGWPCLLLGVRALANAVWMLAVPLN